MTTIVIEVDRGTTLQLVSRKSAVIFEAPHVTSDMGYHFDFHFTAEQLRAFIEKMETAGREAWGAFEPKLANSFSSDYDEYYDRKLDNNGYLSILPTGISVSRPTNDNTRLYQFSKRKFESFMFDLYKKFD